MIFLDLWSLSPTSQLPSNTVLFHKKKVEFPNKFDWQEIENQIDLSTNRKLVYPQIGRDLISHRNPMEDSGQKQDQDWTSVFTQQVKKPIKVDDRGSLCLQVFLIWLKKKQNQVVVSRYSYIFLRIQFTVFWFLQFLFDTNDEAAWY